MKKIYCNPTSDVLMLEPEQLLSESNTFDGTSIITNKETMESGDGSDAAVKHNVNPVDWNN